MTQLLNYIFIIFSLRKSSAHNLCCIQTIIALISEGSIGSIHINVLDVVIHGSACLVDDVLESNENNR